MSSRLLVLATIPLLASLALVSAPAQATSADETCQGQPATVVGSSDQVELVGTAGDDVIVSNGSIRISGLAGDDLICIQGSGAGIDVMAGSGDDSIDAVRPVKEGGFVRAFLGDGADRYQGGPGRDLVFDGDSFGDTGPGDNRVDVVMTGAGDDDLFWSTTDDAFIDRLDAGPGGDVISVSVPLGEASPDSSVDGGDGGPTDTLSLFDPGAGPWTVDAQSGRVTTGERARLRFGGFRIFRLSEGGPSGPSFVGSAADESVTARRVRAVDLGAGDDRLTTSGVSDQAVSGGPGRDSFDFGSDRGVALDLRRGVLESGGDGVERRVTAFENAGVYAPRVTLKGDDGPNVLEVNACQSRVVGRAGRDTFGQLFGGDAFVAQPECDTKRFVFAGGKGADRSLGTRGFDVLYGGPGNDRLDGTGEADRIFGGPGRDVLRGGPGKDVLFGGPDRGDAAFGGSSNKDLCRAERQVGCER